MVAALTLCSLANLFKKKSYKDRWRRKRGMKHCHSQNARNYWSSSLPSLFHPFCPLSSIFHLQRFYPLSSILIHRYSFSSNFINCNPPSSNFIQRYPTGLPWHVNWTKLSILVKLWMCMLVQKTNTCRWLWLRWLWEEIEGRRWAWNSIGPALVSAKSRWKG